MSSDDRDLRDLFEDERAVDLLVVLVGRVAVDRMDPLDPRHGPFFDWLAREARLQQTPAERKETDRQAELFADRMMRRIASIRAAERLRVRCIDHAPATRPVPDDVKGGTAGELGDDRTPLWDLAVAAGSGRELWDEPPAALVEVPADVAPGRYVGLRVAGDSMTPLLHTGDSILVRLGHEAAVDDVIVARHPEEGYVVKRVGRVSASQLELVSLNSAYPVLELTNDPSLVFGIVVLRWCPHDRGWITS